MLAERSSTTRHEYNAGAVHAMAGGSEQHNLIMGNMYASLHSQLRRRQCTVYPSDMHVAIASVPRAMRAILKRQESISFKSTQLLKMPSRLLPLIARSRSLICTRKSFLTPTALDAR